MTAAAAADKSLPRLFISSQFKASHLRAGEKVDSGDSRFDIKDWARWAVPHQGACLVPSSCMYAGAHALPDKPVRSSRAAGYQCVISLFK